MNNTGAASNGGQMMTQLDTANVVYDQLAARLGFKRQPGTRERLDSLAWSLVGTGMVNSQLYAFSGQQQKALLAFIERVGAHEAAEGLLYFTRNPAYTTLAVEGVVFDFLEVV